MLRRRLVKRIKILLWQTSHSPIYLPLVWALAGGATLSMTVPTTAILIPAVMLRPRRWLLICLIAVLGAALGAALLSYGFQMEGWGRLQAHYPELAQSESWKKVVAGVREYGLPALAVICALPLPQTPALIVCAVSELPLPGIFLAVAAGKLAKYGVLSWMVATFPERFIRYLNRGGTAPRLAAEAAAPPPEGEHCCSRLLLSGRAIASKTRTSQRKDARRKERQNLTNAAGTEVSRSICQRIFRRFSRFPLRPFAPSRLCVEVLIWRDCPVLSGGGGRRAGGA